MMLPIPFGCGGPRSIGGSCLRMGSAVDSSRCSWRRSPALGGRWSAFGARTRLASPDDLTSEVFLGAFRSIGSFRGDEAAFRSWLFTIAHRRLQDTRRALSRRAEPEPIGTQEPAPAGSAELEALRREADDRVRRLCDRLVPDQREVLLLRLVAGFTVEEVAATLGKSPGAVKALQRRGVIALRKVLLAEGVPL